MLVVASTLSAVTRSLVQSTTSHLRATNYGHERALRLVQHLRQRRHTSSVCACMCECAAVCVGCQSLCILCVCVSVCVSVCVLHNDKPMSSVPAISVNYGCTNSDRSQPMTDELSDLGESCQLPAELQPSDACWDGDAGRAARVAVAHS
jgi:hypothetical protein